MSLCLRFGGDVEEISGPRIEGVVVIQIAFRFGPAAEFKSLATRKIGAEVGHAES